MQRLTLTIPIVDHEPGDGFQVFGNLGLHGLPAAEIDTDRPLGGPAVRPFFPHAGDELPEDPPDPTVRTTPLYFGWFVFSVQTFDRLGNASSDDSRPRRSLVNSGPNVARNFRATGTIGRQPAFAFTAPEQMR